MKARNILPNTPAHFSTGLASLFLRLSARYRLQLQNQIALSPRRQRPFQILVYHRVNDYHDPFFLHAIPTAHFAQQMAYLARHFTVFTLAELWQRSRDYRLPDNGIAITFDDGYRDFYQYAFPILQRYRLPATLFAATAPLQHRTPLWYDQVFHAFKLTKNDRLELPWLSGISFDLTQTPNRLQALKIFIDHVRRLANAERLSLVQWLILTLNVEVTQWQQENAMLSWQELQTLHQSGIEIGSHTVTHPILTVIAQDQLERELVESKKLLEEKLQAPVTSFAYPNGGAADFNQAAVQVLQRAGYRCAATTIAGNNDSTVDAFALRRLPPYGDLRRDFFMRLLWYRLSM